MTNDLSTICRKVALGGVMYKVISSSPHSYVGCSRKLAFEFARACRRSGACFLIRRRKNCEWRDIAEWVAA